ncbi:uncharacterized protein BT62DRAFT_997345 [Guyanagaster necrorhizus]|uniref:Uncharacterized protein n=1 Tax=Guyanagaster necrorhizus TaxID=856835 RepID=A0A9P8AMQ4_9AGAR|nr:uncharacterized protein BT62DRAFT_997345 [Guyanagaster necrorhizus MCA 3950]KAG7441140.1 hypothetical protein BT62DRAFT_997345 [Guyanagaster necrorhizus MCA 3950]
MPSEGYHPHDAHHRPTHHITSQVHRDYNTTGAALTEGPSSQSQSQSQSLLSQDIANAVAILRTIEKIVWEIVEVLFCIVIALCLLALGFLGAFFGIRNVIGHWILLHLRASSKSYSKVTLLSTFWFGFWGSAITFIPFWLVYVPLRNFLWDTENPILASFLAFLNLVLVTAMVALECKIGVFLARRYGVVTLKLGDAIRVAYTGVVAPILGVCIMLVLLLGVSL